MRVVLDSNIYISALTLPGGRANAALEAAVEGCDVILNTKPRYLIDALRFKGELLNAMGRFEEGEVLYRQILDMRAVPWARLGLARVLHAMGREDEAEAVLLDALEPLGYDHVFPRGTLREPVAGLRRAQAVILSRSELLDADARAAVRRRVAAVTPSAVWAEIAHSPQFDANIGSSTPTFTASPGAYVRVRSAASTSRMRNHWSSNRAFDS